MTAMRREIGLFGGISVLAGIMIGSGIFYIGGIVLARCEMSLGLSLLVWLVGGLITLMSGVCYAELGAMMPKAGGSYVYLREAYGERTAFVSGFSNFILSSSASIAALAVAFAGALATVLPLGPIAQKVVAVGTIVALSLVQIRGIRTGAFVQNVFMVLKLLPIGLIMIAGLFFGTESPDLLAMPSETLSLTAFLPVVAFAVVATLWAYEGWHNLNSIAEEIKNPQRNIPLAILLSIVGVALLYVLFNYSIFRVLSPEVIAAMVSEGNFYLGTAAAETLFGTYGGVLVSAAMILAIFNSLNGCVMVFPRVYYAMARDGAMVRSLGVLHPELRTPVNAIIASGAISIGLVLLRDLSSLTSLVAVSGIIFNALTFYAVIILRRRMPTVDRPYKVWAYPYLIWAVILVMAALLASTIIADPVTALLNVIVPAVSLVVYEVFFRRNVEALEAERRAALAAEGAAG